MATVLLVDDDSRLLDALSALVESERHEAIKALNGAEALARARACRPALIITDYMMPVMDGEALVKALANDPALAHVPVVLVSALPASPVALAVSAYIRKPFAAARLVELLREHTGKKGGASR